MKEVFGRNGEKVMVQIFVGQENSAGEVVTNEILKFIRELAIAFGGANANPDTFGYWTSREGKTFLERSTVISVAVPAYHFHTHSQPEVLRLIAEFARKAKQESVLVNWGADGAQVLQFDFSNEYVEKAAAALD